MKSLKKSKTIWFNLIIASVGILELNLHLLQSVLGEYYGAVFIFVAMIGAWLRVLTTANDSSNTEENTDKE